MVSQNITLAAPVINLDLPTISSSNNVYLTNYYMNKFFWQTKKLFIKGETIYFCWQSFYFGVRPVLAKLFGVYFGETFLGAKQIGEASFGEPCKKTSFGVDWRVTYYLFYYYQVISLLDGEGYHKLMGSDGYHN